MENGSRKDDAEFPSREQRADVHDHGTAFQQSHGVQIYYANNGSKNSSELANTAHLLTLENIPRFRECDNSVSFGVHPAATWDGNQQPSYIKRDVDDDLFSLLKPGSFVLLVGDATSGKSRTAFEVAKGKFPDRHVFRPEDGSEFDDCVLLANSDEKLLWVDDLDRFLTEPVLSVGLLDQALRSGAVMVGAMRADSMAMLSPRHERGLNQETRKLVRSARAVTARAHILYLDRQWSPEEIERATRSSDPRVREAARHSEEYGIAEYLAAGPQLFLEWQNAWAPGLHPRGAAIVSAAVDLRRAGVKEPVPKQVLERLHECYLEQRGGMRLRPEPMLDAFHWALEPLHATSSLLVPVQNEMFRAFDYLEETVAREGKTPNPPDEVWESAINEFSLESVHGVGHRAEKANRKDFALRAYERLAQGGNGDGSFHLGHMSAKEDRLEEAELWYRKAISQGSSVSKNNLGLVLLRSGRPDEAEVWFREAAADGDSYGMRNLAEQLFDREEWQGAESSFTSFMEESPSVAKLLMGQLRIRQDKCEDALEWLQQSAAEGNRDAWFFLGIANERLEDWESAASCYEKAIKVGVKEAPNNMASVLRKTGKVKEAEVIYRSAIEERNDTYAVFNLANLLAETGRHEEAEPLYRRSMATGFEYAKNNLALSLEKSDRGEEAEQLFREAAAEGDTRAMANLANRCRRDGRAREALAWINRVISTGKPGYYTEMGLIQETLGHPNRAMFWYKRAIDGGSSGAAVAMGYLQERRGRGKVARRLYSQAAQDGDSHALYHLGQYYLRRSDIKQAYKYVNEAHEAGERVSHMLAYLAMHAGDLAKARALLDQTSDEEAPEAVGLRRLLHDLELRVGAVHK
ncbi:tetratricopeptide repeat protein [Streptomyces sp. NPDC058240]|uniref:tetratricopeptide repeat protein n=1 Tax=Streptomyces sp. NPDC058240 TaxID=3346396 RepID=UPI0036EDD619